MARKAMHNSWGQFQLRELQCAICRVTYLLKYAIYMIWKYNISELVAGECLGFALAAQSCFKQTKHFWP